MGSIPTTSTNIWEIRLEEQYQSVGPCACMGRQGDDPYCPCEMRLKGLVPTNPWTPEKIEELNKALSGMFGWKDKSS